MSAKILIIDDEPINNLLLSSCLTSSYYMVCEAVDTASAMKKMADEKPDLIILDAFMPKENGFDFARRIKMHPKYWDIPIIMVTALNNRDSAMQAVICGIDDFIVKPFDVGNLLFRVKTLLKQKYYIDIAGDIAASDDNFVSQIAPSLYPSECAGIAVASDSNTKINCSFFRSHNISFFTNPDKMLEKINNNADDYDICMIDFFAKEFDPKVLCAKILASKNGRFIPIIAMIKDKGSIGGNKKQYEEQIKFLEFGVSDSMVFDSDSIELELRLSAQIRFRRYIKILRGRFSETARLARTDTLTGAYNRFYFVNAMEKSYKDVQLNNYRSSLIMFDIDHFKKINDNYGHVVGDQALRQFTLKVKEYINDSDILCRYGGEEFALIVPKRSIAGARNVANDILQGFSQDEILCGRRKLNLSFSAGVAEFSKSDLSFQEVIQRADEALYRAKKDGRGCVRISKRDTDDNIIKFPGKVAI